MSTHPLIGQPSPWVERFAPLVQQGGTILDVAAGSGRHARFFAARGHKATAVDIDIRGLADTPPGVEIVEADLEGSPWPFGDRRFACVVVTRYLHRPLFPHLVDAVAPGGLLLYETFMVGNEHFGRPSNPAFLLRPDELLDLARGRLSVVAFEQGEVSSPNASVIQRIAAVAGDPPHPLPSAR